MKLYQIIACLIPIKKYRKAFRNYARNNLNLQKIEDNYQKQIHKIRTLSRVNVYFLVWENCKWSYDDIYIKFSKDSRFNPKVLLIDCKHPLCHLDQNKEFFEKKGMQYAVIKKVSELKKLNPHIIFYEQPWFVLNNSFAPSALSKWALCFYVPYGIGTDLHESIMIKHKGFYLGCYKHFVFNADVKKEMEKYGINNSLAMGHPRLDVYLKDTPKNPSNKFRIIYAPHHSFENSILKWATFDWNGEFMLQLARKYKDSAEWIFKPHPKFYSEISKKYGKEYADSIFNQWKEIGKICNTGNYFDLFKTSDLMISDCGSFQIEWLPTLKPYIHLVSQNKNAEKPSPLRQHFIGGYYHANNIDEIQKYFSMIVENHQDPLKTTRESLAKEIPQNVSEQIYHYIKGIVQ